MGVIPRLVFEILSDASGPLAVGDIHRDVEAAIGGPVAVGTTKNALSRMARDPASPVVRAARGRYRLAQ